MGQGRRVTTVQPSVLDAFQGRGEMGALMRAYDWAATPLGAPETWPRGLHSIVRMMLTSRYQMWMAWGEDLTFFCNDAYLPTLGIKHPWALGKSARRVWAEIWPEIGPLIDHVLATGEATYSEAMRLFLQRSGFPEETYHTFSYSPLFDDVGAIAGMFCVVVEETDRVINERRLDTLRRLASATSAVRTEDELFDVAEREVGQNLADLPFTLTYLFDEGRASARLVALSGAKPNDPVAIPILSDGAPLWREVLALRQSVSALVEDLDGLFSKLPMGVWDRPPEAALLFPIAQQGKALPAGVLVVGCNPYRPVDEAYRGFADLLAGQIAAALSSVRAFEAERRRAEGLAELDRAKTAFFSNVSHEFRTPLTLMLGPLEGVLDGPCDAEVRGHIELAHRNGMRLLRLVNSLLDFSRIEAGRVQASFAPTDFATLNGEIASNFRSVIERAGLTLEIVTHPLPDAVFLDSEMWDKVLLNLLSNAFKFTFEGGVTVETGPSRDGRFAELRVRDTGIGIPAEHIPRLFERFHRVEGAQGRSFEGSGIGLALVHELIQLHGGSITVESAPQQGATFTVRLPYGAAHLPPDRVQSEAVSHGRSYATALIDEALHWLPEGQIAPEAAEVEAARLMEPGRRILLADDNSDMRAYVRRLLEARGYEVETVADGGAALAAARARPPDLILSDVMMPGLDGFGLLRAVRGDLALASIPVILLSARAGEEAKVEGLEAGADDYLIKPFAARELLARVDANIHLARLRREAARTIVQSEQRVLMTQERLALALATGRIAIFEFDSEARRVVMLGSLAQSFGVEEHAAAEGLPPEAYLDGLDSRDRSAATNTMRGAIARNETFEVEYRLTRGARQVVARGGAQRGPDGRRRVVGVVIDISEEKQAQALLRERTDALEVLNRTGSAVAAELDLANVVQAVTDAGVELTKAAFGAFFYNVVTEAGEAYRLYSLSGAPREAFASFPMPRNTAIFAPTFAGQRVVRSNDITEDPAFGRSAPHHGMPEGHLPVRSYLAVPVKSRNGEVLGGLLFGHEAAGVFDERAEHVMTGLAAQAAVAIDNARLYEAAHREIERRRMVETQLHALNADLENRVSVEVGERMKVEAALREAQKMEAVGQLTGGVAHDFNNLLTVIIGGLETVRRNLPDDNSRTRRALDMATNGANRAATLTQRLLAFSRRQPLDPRPLDLNAVVRQSKDLLRGALGETIELADVLTQPLWLVEVDQNQLESAILNLAVNARDAMPTGGKLTIQTANTTLDETYVATDSEVSPGQYAMLSIADSGEGMSRAVLERAFEPFYTTKEVGRGTGLGLSMVYGFAKQSGGHVVIDSEPGHGTTVKLYFPRYGGALAADREESGAEAPESLHNETVLLVEDNDDVRAYSRSILTELGYQVLVASDAEAGSSILREPGRIDVLFTDVVLPGRSGRELADEAQRLRPSLKVLFTTGYSRNAIVHHGRLDPGVQLITKPFTFEQLARRLRAVLDA
jgi:signal transduction histidine kinase/DNA-binding response OmpR family regulator